jgi:hypothetical protein
LCVTGVQTCALPISLIPNIGDKLELTGRVGEYYGWTNIDSLVQFTIHSTGNPVPETTHVHVVDLAGGCGFASEPFENVLVKLDTVTITSGDPLTGKWWIHDSHSTNDSIRMYNYLWEGGPNQPANPPSVGARYVSIVGVLSYEGRNTVPYIRGFQLLPRIGSDYVSLNIPQANITAAWPIDPTHLGVLFDRAVQPASAQTPGNYHTVKSLGISAAVLDAGNRIVTLTTAAQTNDRADTIIVANVADSAFGIPMTNPDSVRFWQGFTPIVRVQTPNAGGDTSAIRGDVVTIKGVVVADTTSFYFNTFYLNDVSDSIYNGVTVAPVVRASWMLNWPVIGDTFVMTGYISEYFQETEVTGIANYKNFYLVNHGPAPAPYYKSTNAATYKLSSTIIPEERLEGVLSKLCDSLVAIEWAPIDSYVQKLVSLTTGDTVGIEAQASHFHYAHVPGGTHINGLTGIVRWRRGMWKLVPRSEADFNTGLDCGGTPPACEYLIGDINGDNQRLGGDVTYGVRFFKGIGNPPPDSCYMDSTHAYMYVAGDCNGNCEFRGSDITRLVAFFKGTAHLSCCHFFPTTVPPFRGVPGSDDKAIIRDSKTTD